MLIYRAIVNPDHTDFKKGIKRARGLNALPSSLEENWYHFFFFFFFFSSTNWFFQRIYHTQCEIYGYKILTRAIDTKFTQIKFKSLRSRSRREIDRGWARERGKKEKEKEGNNRFKGNYVIDLRLSGGRYLER